LETMAKTQSKTQEAPPASAHMSPMVFKDVDATGAEIYILSKDAWLDEDTISNATFSAKPPRDNTAFAHRSSREGASALAEQYLSAACDVGFRTPNGISTAPVLALTGVRILAQSPTKGQAGGYGTDFVRLAVPSKYIEALRRGLASAKNTILDPPVEKSNRKSAGGITYITFTVNIAKCPVEVENDEGERTMFTLSDLMSKHKDDLVANVVFNLSLKYKGPRLTDPATAAYHVSLAPTRIFVQDISDTSVDPTPAGLTIVSDAELPVKGRGSSRLLQLMSKLGVRDGEVGEGVPEEAGAVGKAVGGHK